MQSEPLLPWPQMEAQLRERPKWAVAGLMARAGLRLLPAIAEATEQYGPEALEWTHASAAALDAVVKFAHQRSVSRFTLDLAADIARGTANAAANVVRMLGTSRAAETAELVFAVVAYAADVARSSQVTRWAQFATLGLRAADATERIPRVIWESEWQACVNAELAWLQTSLWPDGEPTWFVEGLAKWHAVRATFPVVLQV